MDEINTKIILLRKSLKSIINQTKLKLVKKINSSKARSKERKMSELLCFQNNRVKSTDIPLSLGLYPEKLEKIITDCNSLEIDRVHARILSNSLVQKTLNALKNKFGLDMVSKFLKTNDKKIRKAGAAKLVQSNTKSKLAEDKGIKKTEKKLSISQVDQVKPKKSTTKSKSVEKVSRSIDPFFMDAQGEIYYSSATLIQDDDDDFEEEAAKKEYAVPQKRKAVEKKLEVIKEQVNKIKEFKEQKDDIHPSWKAKQQMKKVQIQEFKGTKIVFD